VYWGSPLQPATPSIIGGFCGFASGTGSNLSVGGGSLAAVTGSANTALGISAATSLTGGNRNVALGTGSLALETAGSCNVAVGFCALYNSAGGVGNTAAGAQAGSAITTGDNNTFIGALAGNNVTTQNNQIVIGANGNSCTTGSVNGGVTFAGSGTATWITMGNTAWSGTSDARLKEEVADLALGLDFINQIQPRTFKWKNDGSKAAGFNAQEAAAVVESHSAEYLGLVDDTNEYMGVAAGALIPVLVNAVKELKAEIEELKAKLS